MIKNLKNKRGVSLAELMAAIVIIGLASTSLTTMIITAMRGQVKATQYLLAKEVASTYNTMFCRDIQKANLITIGEEELKSSDPNDKYITLTEELISSMTKVGTEESQTYKYLYDSNSILSLNNKTFDSSTVTIRFKLINVKVGFEIEVKVTYDGNKVVTSSGRQYFI